MRTFGLPRNPSVLPSRPTAELAPRSRAAFTPALASDSLRSASERAHARWATSPSKARDEACHVKFRRSMKVLPMKKMVFAAAAVLALAIGGAGYLALGQREAAPAVDMVLLDGSKHNIAEFKGKVVLVNFWATSCTTCVKEMP